MQRRTLLHAAALSAAAPWAARAQGGYPSKPIRLIVGFPRPAVASTSRHAPSRPGWKRHWASLSSSTTRPVPVA